MLGIKLIDMINKFVILALLKASAICLEMNEFLECSDFLRKSASIPFSIIFFYLIKTERKELA